MSSENKRKAEANEDGGHDVKASRDADKTFGPEAQALLDSKIADGTVCDA